MAEIRQVIAHHDEKFVDELEALSHTDIAPDLSISSVMRRLARATETGSGISAQELEVQMGLNDLLDVNYLERGREAAKLVCLIEIEATPTDSGGTGTGFLVGPNLLLTNLHVLENKDVARRATAVFSYEHDIRGERQTPVRFQLDPDAGFWGGPSNAELDFALVAVKAQSQNGARAIKDMGFLRLNPATGKTDAGMFVTVVGHPEGQHKQVALRENQVMKVGDDQPHRDSLLWYKADTLPGSSGSPVFNDLWQVAALHHAGIPKTKSSPSGTRMYLLKGEPEAVDDSWVAQNIAENMKDEALEWVANEGVRISRIVAYMRGVQKNTPHAALQAWLDDMDSTRPYPGTLPEAPIVSRERREDEQTQVRAFEGRRRQRQNTRPLSAGRNGYQADFLDEPVPLPGYDEAVRRFGPVTPLLDNTGVELQYTNFSVVMSQKRKMAFFTAVNIDGNQLENPPRGDDWAFDDRIDRQFQIGNELYTDEPGNYFDRGHLVRRLDPVWGRDAQQANVDTFCWTNIAPQYWEFNQGDHLWQGLENFILYNTDSDDLRATVFTGPVFAEDDPLHRGVLLPQRFWKVVVVRDDSGKLSSSAYVVSQEQYVRNIGFENLPVGPHNGFQIAVTSLEQQTGLDFGEMVRKADVFEGREAKELRRLADVRHTRRKAEQGMASQEALREVGQAASSASLVRFELGDGRGTVLVEASGAASSGFQSNVRLEGARGRGAVVDAAETFQAALEKAKPALQAIANFLQDVNSPNEIGVELGLKVSADAGVILAKVGTEGTLKVSLKWVNEG